MDKNQVVLVEVGLSCSSFGATVGDIEYARKLRKFP